MKKVVLGAVAVACMAAGMSAQADSRPEGLKKYLGTIGEQASQHHYDQVTLSVVEQDVSFHADPGVKPSGYELRATKMLGGNHLYGIGEIAITDDEGLDSQRFALGLGIQADLGFKGTATDFYTELSLVNYDTTQKVGAKVNEDDGVTVEWRAGLRSNWGIDGVDSRLYVGMSDVAAYSGYEEGGIEGVLGASLGYNLLPQLTVSVAVERLSGTEWKQGNTDLSFDESVTTSLSLSYNF